LDPAARFEDRSRAAEPRGLFARSERSAAKHQAPVRSSVETFGDPGDPAILLVMGSSGSMDWWEDDFCQRLAAGHRFVIRYDHRDTGRSVTYEPGAPKYSFGRVFDRTLNIASSFTNHHLLNGGDRWRERLGELGAPTLVVHGTEDPVLPYEHGLALANEIPGAELLTLEGMGHELPRAMWDVVVPAILEHTASGLQRRRSPRP